MKTMTTVDVRATPPMHRFDTIMSAYEALPAGEAMHLIVAVRNASCRQST